MTTGLSGGEASPVLPRRVQDKQVHTGHLAIKIKVFRRSCNVASAASSMSMRKISQLEQQAADLRIQLSERDDELAAARAANRALMTRINHAPKT